jgi:putative ABC transport system permease protein
MQAVQRQISLPLSKAIEIAWKSIRLRLSRSLLVTSAIVLALAFLMSILTTQAVIRGMRGWINSHPSQIEAQNLEAKMKSNGVPTTPEEINNDRIQTRWLMGLALLVAFVGILNAMLMSVTERFREIGTMKCLGALDGLIVKLFLIESLFQGIAGTLIGTVIGLLLTLCDASWKFGVYVWKAFPTGVIAFDLLVCMTIGVGLTVIAAVYPAWQAARMQPVEAMRVET